MLDARAVHLESTSKMFNLRHNADIPANVLDRTRCLGVTSIVIQELLAFPQSGIVITNDFE